MVSFGFFGSSQSEIAQQYDPLVEQILINIFKNHKKVRIITGGYDGFMKTVCKQAKEIITRSDFRDCYLETYGILYSGYREEANSYLDRSIKAHDIGERVNSLIELSDFLIGLPGSNGTLHEILHANEILKYPSFESKYLLGKKLFIHEFWKDSVYFKNNRFFNDPNGLDLVSLPSSEDTVNQITPLSAPNIIDKIKNVIGLEDYKSNLVLGFDFAFTTFSEEFGLNHGKSKSFATKTYGKILKAFLDKHPSILNFDRQIMDFQKLSSTLVKSKEPLMESEMPISSKLLKEVYSPKQVFDTWNNHLETFNFGKLSFCVSEPLQFDQISINVSCFLVLDIDLPNSKSERIMSLLKSHILTEGLSFILKQIRPYLRTTAELATYKEYTSAHQHLIKNMQFKGSLAEIEIRHLKKSERADELMRVIKSTVLLRDISSQLFYSYDDNLSTEIFDIYKIKTISALLELIHDSGYVAFKNLEIFSIEKEVLVHPSNFINQADFLNVFNVIHNIYSNTRKHGGDDQFEVLAKVNSRGNVEINFTTRTELGEHFLMILNNESNDYFNNPHKGFRHISDSIKKLENFSISARSENLLTTIKIIIT